MRTVFAIAIASALLMTSRAEALPASSQLRLAPAASMVTEAKVVCRESGHCYRPAVRRPVAKWVYGDNNFSGPYTGPGNYGSPAYRYRWWPFFW
ncbi:hypothetical protein [uncultured Bradyrhizobium sp.]|uniref:hypothetical protein n=1 Tax=uncultured Bradyrhizobium sp. TaxID=199684 RepID=UPI00263471AD|nr:hypothetical protein [uncultured Bradyrhizobium sp.]